MKIKILTIVIAIVVLAVVTLYEWKINSVSSPKAKTPDKTSPQNTTQDLNSLSIAAERQRQYPGSNITIEEALAPGSNYNQYIVSYLSDGLKINALLTVPAGQKPKDGWPVIVFNHGYIPPEQYTTTGRYVDYVAAFARSGYIVIKPDYRGNGNSQGKPDGAYYSSGYTTDVLNALASIKRYKDANPNKIGMWGHSMGGNITLRVLVVDTKDIKVAVIWGGVVGSYSDLMYNWHRAVPFVPSQRELQAREATGGSRMNFIAKYGTPKQNPAFWNSIDPTYFVSDITAPVQLDVGGADTEVPPAFSQSLYGKLKNAGKTVEFYEYPGSDHNISQGFDLAMQRSIDFFNKIGRAHV